MRALLVHMVFLLTCQVAAQPLAMDAVSRGLARADIARTLAGPFPDNPAAARYVAAAGLTRLFELAELSFSRIVAGASVRDIEGSISLAHMGFDAYSLSVVSIGVAQHWPGSLSIGLRAGLERERIGSMVSSAAHELSLGLLLPTGAATTLAGTAVRAGEESNLAIGGAHALTDNAEILAAARVFQKHPPSSHLALEWRPVPSLLLRGGMATAPDRWALGIGLRPGRLAIDWGIERHPELGWTWTVDLGRLP